MKTISKADKRLNDTDKRIIKYLRDMLLYYYSLIDLDDVFKD